MLLAVAAVRARSQGDVMSWGDVVVADRAVADLQALDQGAIPTRAATWPCFSDAMKSRRAASASIPEDLAFAWAMATSSIMAPSATPISAM